MTHTADPTPLICHCLIGPPGSGKSALSQQWIARSAHYVWVSTDGIRERLYGEASVQGEWDEVEREAIEQIRAAIAQNQPVIYDATNAKRAWRIDLMRKLSDGKTLWMAWWVKTSLAECKKRNKGWARQVPTGVIERMHKDIKAMPPIPAEGFAAVNVVPLGTGKQRQGTSKKKPKQNQDLFDFGVIERKIQVLPQSLMQRQRRQGQYQLHPYSSLLAFERLLYLISALLTFPGLGSLRECAPERLKTALGKDTLPAFDSPIAEISAVMISQYGALYGEPAAIVQNLDWLQANGLVNGPYRNQPIELTDSEQVPQFGLHRYADKDAFTRLISTFRFVVHHPFLCTPGKGSLKTLVAAMEAQKVIPVGYIDSVRRDIGEVLKPYGLIPEVSQSHGYFAGTAILATSELLRVFEGLAGQVHHLKDPVLLTTYETFRERLTFLQPALATSDVFSSDVFSYPVRSVLQQPIVDTQQLPTHTISLAAPGNAERLEAAIREGRCLMVKRRRGTGRFAGEQEAAFEVLPLQVVFHNIAWYLGYRQTADGLLRFERLDRLELFEVGTAAKGKGEQGKALQDLMRLYRASYGLHLGNSASEQRAFLSGDAQRRAKVEVLCELWFTDDIFRFVSEGSQRFPGRQKMSPRLTGSVMTQAEKKRVFCLKKTGDRCFPNRLQVRLPQWVVARDVDFKRWILGFGGKVKVVAPQSLVDSLRMVGRDIVSVYE